MVAITTRHPTPLSLPPPPHSRIAHVTSASRLTRWIFPLQGRDVLAVGALLENRTTELNDTLMGILSHDRCGDGGGLGRGDGRAGVSFGPAAGSCGLFR